MGVINLVNLQYNNLSFSPCFHFIMPSHSHATAQATSLSITIFTVRGTRREMVDGQPKYPFFKGLLACPKTY